MYTFDWCVQSMFTCSRKWAFCPTWPWTEWWIIFLHSRKVIASRSGVMPVWDTVSVITDLFLYRERCSGCCVIWLCLVYASFFFFSHVFLIHSIHVYKHISRALWWHIFWTKELCYSYRLYQLSNLHEKWRWQFTGSQNSVIRFRTEIGQADDFNSLHDREREESTKSLLLPVTVCYINSCNISDLCSFNLIISACLCFGA